MAHKLAIANAHITADVIEITEFPELAQRYHIYGVPKIVISVQGTQGIEDTQGTQVEFEGALPELRFVQEVLRAVQSAGEVADRPDGPDGGGNTAGGGNEAGEADVEQP